MHSRRKAVPIPNRDFLSTSTLQHQRSPSACPAGLGQTTRQVLRHHNPVACSTTFRQLYSCKRVKSPDANATSSEQGSPTGGKRSPINSDEELKAPSLLPDCGPRLPTPATNSLLVSANFRCSCTPGRIHQMLIMCLFSLSAILAAVLITIYILQHLHWEKRTHPNSPRLAEPGY